MDWAHEFIKYALPVALILWASLLIPPFWCRYRRYEKEARGLRISKYSLPAKREKK